MHTTPTRYPEKSRFANLHERVDETDKDISPLTFDQLASRAGRYNVRDYIGTLARFTLMLDSGGFANSATIAKYIETAMTDLRSYRGKDMIAIAGMHDVLDYSVGNGWIAKDAAVAYKNELWSQACEELALCKTAADREVEQAEHRRASPTLQGSIRNYIWHGDRMLEVFDKIPNHGAYLRDSSKYLHAAVSGEIETISHNTIRSRSGTVRRNALDKIQEVVKLKTVNLPGREIDIDELSDRAANGWNELDRTTSVSPYQVLAAATAFVLTFGASRQNKVAPPARRPDAAAA